MIIQIEIKMDNNELIAKETAFNFESAGESLGKLERFYAKSIPVAEEKIRKIDKEFAKQHPDSQVSNQGENNENEQI